MGQAQANTTRARSDDEAFETLLRAWGRYYGERPERDEDAPSRPTHPLARGMEFAPGKRAVLTLGRGGQSRRRFLGQVAGLAGIMPAAFVDPVPCKETRPAVFGAGETSRPVPVELQRVNRAALDLLAVDRKAGLVLRVHYCRRGTLDEKPGWVSDLLGATVGLRVYREALAQARGYMQGRLS